MAFQRKACKVYSLSKCAKVLHLRKEKENSYVENTESYGENDFSVVEVVKKEKGICVCFAVASQTAKISPEYGISA